MCVEVWDKRRRIEFPHTTWHWALEQCVSSRCEREVWREVCRHVSSCPIEEVGIEPYTGLGVNEIRFHYILIERFHVVAFNGNLGWSRKNVG